MIDAPGTAVWSWRASGARSEDLQAKPGGSASEAWELHPTPGGCALHTGRPHRRSEAPALESF
eukprot:11092163-Alexandrium_andersonii.AAC.1